MSPWNRAHRRGPQGCGSFISRAAALCGILSTSGVFQAAAQTPDILRERPTARVAALGGAGIAAIGLLDARSINPALLASDVSASFSLGFFKTSATDVTGARVGVTGGFRRLGNVSLDMRRRQIENLLEDPVLAEDPNLKVSDWGIQLGYARKWLGGRFQLGAIWETLSSRVFGTTGNGWTVDVGAAAAVTSEVSVGITVARLGPKYEWRDALGGGMQSPQGRTFTSGLRWSIGRERRLGLQVAGDVVRALEQTGEQGLRVGGEVSLLQRIFLRAGYAEMREAGETRHRNSAAGLGLRLRNIRIDIARDRLGSVVGERTLVDFTVRR